jgi:hypothetical protein
LPATWAIFNLRLATANAVSFYTDLPVRERFRDVTDPAAYAPVPPGWHVAVTDVEGSTQAIGAGRYREVNLVGASAIIALLNLEDDLELPFAFGGDGAMVLVPPRLEEAARPVLADTRRMACEEFDLTLRAGLVPVAAVRSGGHDVRVARLHVSEDCHQAMFDGGGLAYAEALVKGEMDAAATRYAVAEDADGGEADFSGLECRWQDVPSPREETLALLVQATAGSAEDDRAVYRRTLDRIEQVYGTEDRYRPLSFDTMNPSFRPRKLSGEARVRRRGGSWNRGGSWKRRFGRLAYEAEIWVRNAFLTYLIPREVETGGADRAGTTEGVRWDRYVERLVATSDFRKYDGALRMVIAGTTEERARLTDFLEEEHAAGRLAHGLHVTDRALVTCVVFERMGRQIHFIDAADGGYAQAARAMKRRLRERSTGEAYEDGENEKPEL